MAEVKKRMLVLENGSVHEGTGFGSMNDAVCELVFNTSMVGYQEIVTDPGYTAQMVAMTYPLIGNYGITDEDNEARLPAIGGLVVREYCDMPSNFRYTKTLGEILEENGIPGLEGVDTRRISRMLRSEGVMRALICDADTPIDEAMARIRAYRLPTDCVSRVSCKKKWYARTPNPRYNVVAIDCGIRLSLIRGLNACGCNVTVAPFDTPAETILSFKPDGVFVAGGPGDPHDALPVAQTLRALRGRLPVLGVGLGHLLMAMACGAQVSKMKFGHHGSNQPVRELATGKVDITAQNHGFVAEEAGLEGTGLAVTHKNLLDGTVEGLACEADRFFGAQFESDALFARFMQLMEGEMHHA